MNSFYSDMAQSIKGHQIEANKAERCQTHPATQHKRENSAAGG